MNGEWFFLADLFFFLLLFILLLAFIQLMSKIVLLTHRLMKIFDVIDGREFVYKITFISF